MNTVSTTQLRCRFAERLSSLYSVEVPAYNTLVDVSREVNERVLRRDGATAEQLGSLARVTSERHGAIRVGTAAELGQVARIFGALGMHPAGFYDLRDAHPLPVPVVSTAFRPLAREELAQNPFRMFTSVLVPEDRRFFDEELGSRLQAFLAARQLFPDELLILADRAQEHGELAAATAERFLDLATHAFALSSEPVDRAWYAALEQVSVVAADIGGVQTTHLNHLTPRVLDIDELHRVMTERGIVMLDEIQGPPRWDGPDVLLRQTSFRALAEPRTFREADGTLRQGSLRVRFGEVEARGVALSSSGRVRYEQLVQAVDRVVVEDPGRPRSEIAAAVWNAGMPNTYRELERQGLAQFTYRVADAVPAGAAPHTRDELIDHGWLHIEPIVYEDFLPRSAAGIFSSNLSDGARHDDQQGGPLRDAAWLAAAIGRPLHVPEDGYAAESAASLASVSERLGIVLQGAKEHGSSAPTPPPSPPAATTSPRPR